MTRRDVGSHATETGQDCPWVPPPEKQKKEVPPLGSYIARATDFFGLIQIPKDTAQGLLGPYAHLTSRHETWLACIIVDEPWARRPLVKWVAHFPFFGGGGPALGN